MERRAKIVATLGPSSDNEAALKKLVLAGMDIARLNFSHGTHEEHIKRIQTIRKVSEELQKPITILQDLQGPKLRVGILPPDGILLVKDQIVALTPVDEESNAIEENITILPLDVPNLARAVNIGNRILLDDGNLEMETTKVVGNCVYARVILGGKLSSHKGVNLPGTDLKIPGFTPKDRADLEFGLAHGIDVVAISFVCGPEDVLEVKAAIQEMAPGKFPPPVIAKLERPQAIENLEAIIEVADGVMVARGDLGVETSPSSVPIFQKMIIDAAFRHAKVVITATQMLDSMINNPRPTRAEASDVANAVLDGTDAVMLSGETAVGKYPVEAVAMMDSIIKEAEANFDQWGYAGKQPLEQTRVDAVAITRAAGELAYDRDVAYIAVLTQSGKTAKLMSKVHPKVPILAFTTELKTYRNLSLYWGVKPFQVPHATTIEDMVAFVEEAIIASTPVKSGQQIIFVASLPMGDMRPPNFLLLHTIGTY
ncbi:MAG: pyruvate kinase [Chloroflexi bacterium HGW-Chloroflexi-10]|nr:MAG: pyruvate kinase [Chloroflexi bacterium HGW-Chloroflexi-10]